VSAGRGGLTRIQEFARINGRERSFEMPEADFREPMMIRGVGLCCLLGESQGNPKQIAISISRVRSRKGRRTFLSSLAGLVLVPDNYPPINRWAIFFRPPGYYEGGSVDSVRP
jgi:hypothetical protein